MNAKQMFGITGVLLGLAATVHAQPPKGGLRPEQGKLASGDAAPTFELADADGKNAVKLADLKGKPTVLVFGSCT